MRRILICVVSLLLLMAGAAATPAGAMPKSWPMRIGLPDGFAPEGIAIGRGTTFYVGSIPTGALYRGDLRTGDGTVIHSGGDEARSIGLAVDQRERVFIAGGDSGRARVVDGRTGELLATFQLTSGRSFINDVVVAAGSAWFTDSVNPVLYRVALDLSGFDLVPLSGALVYQQGFNVNGIDATPDGKTLVLVQSNTGNLFTSNLSGVTKRIDLGGEAVTQGDGILLAGKTLYVLQNRANLVAVVDLMAGEVVARFTNAGFSVPTTLDRFGSTLYAVNARFGTPVTPTTQYWVTGFRM